MNYLLIGSNSAIAKDVYQQLKNDGHSVWTMSRSDEMDRDKHATCNVTSEDFPKDFLPEKLHGLVYFPGTIILKPFNRISVDEFLSDFSINVLGAVKSIQAALLALKKGNASVVLISSVAAQKGLSYHASIASSKAAIEGLSRSLAAEYAPAIRFNVVAPSITDTPLANKLLNTEDKKVLSGKRHPLARIGNTTDIADSILFLLSKKSSWVTGQTLAVDGGMSTLNVYN
jgi:3-oxoacyl-[acyl-carrier protein] reductase